jgi:hypothetical protein
MSEHFRGWVVSPLGWEEPVFLPYAQRSLLLTGPNGVGKSRLLNAVTSEASRRVYEGLPRSCGPILALVRELMTGSLPEAIREMTDLTPDELSSLIGDVVTGSDDEEWFADAAGREGPFAWMLRADAQPSLSAFAWKPEKPSFQPTARLTEFPVPAAIAQRTVEAWIRPGTDLDTRMLPERTGFAFRGWFKDLTDGLGWNIKQAANILVGLRQDGSESLLEVAEDWCTAVAARTTERLAALTGFEIEFRIDAANEFVWYAIEAGRRQTPVDGLSNAMRRWTVAAAAETLREFKMTAAGRSHLPRPREPRDCRWAFPEGSPTPFVTRDAWVALDEPELHLFPSELKVLSATLAQQAARGRSIVVTHSLDLASAFVGTTDFVTFDSAESFTIRPADSELAALLTQLGLASPAILGRTRVLYVEGYWDSEIIELLYGQRLARANVILTPMHGVFGAVVLSGSVWHRMLGTEFGVMFDALKQTEIERDWSELRAKVRDRPGAPDNDARRRSIAAELRRAASQKQAHEEAAIRRLYALLIESRMEERCRMVMHGLSDIFQVIAPRIFQLDAETWLEAGYLGKRSFKAWLKDDPRNIDLTDSRTTRRVFNAFRRTRSTEAAAHEALSRAVADFVDS